MIGPVLRIALATVPGGRHGELGCELEATLDDAAAAGGLSSTREAVHLVLLGVALRARRATDDGMRPWRAGLSAGATACIVVRTALAAVRIGTVPSGSGSRFASGLAFLPTGPVEAVFELAVAVAGVVSSPAHRVAPGSRTPWSCRPRCSAPYTCPAATARPPGASPRSDSSVSSSPGRRGGRRHASSSPDAPHLAFSSWAPPLPTMETEGPGG